MRRPIVSASRNCCFPPGDSDAYLSQLETEKISCLRLNVLNTLAVLPVRYELFVEEPATWLPVGSELRFAGQSRSSPLATFASDDLALCRRWEPAIGFASADSGPKAPFGP